MISIIKEMMKVVEIPLTAPSNFSGYANSYSSAYFTWTNISQNAELIVVEAYDPNTGDYIPMNWTGGNANAIQVDGLEENTGYSFRLRVDKNGQSVYTDSIYIQTPASPPNIIGWDIVEQHTMNGQTYVISEVTLDKGQNGYSFGLIVNPQYGAVFSYNEVDSSEDTTVRVTSIIPTTTGTFNVRINGYTPGGTVYTTTGWTSITLG